MLWGEMSSCAQHHNNNCLERLVLRSAPHVFRRGRYKVQKARMFSRVAVAGCFTTQPVEISRLAAVICRGTVLRSRTLRFTPKSATWLAPRMSVLAELHKENEAIQQPVMKAQKLDSISTLQVKFLSPHAVLPKRGSVKAAGYDLARSAHRQ